MLLDIIGIGFYASSSAGGLAFGFSQTAEALMTASWYGIIILVFMATALVSIWRVMHLRRQIANSSALPTEIEKKATAVTERSVEVQARLKVLVRDYENPLSKLVNEMHQLRR